MVPETHLDLRSRRRYNGRRKFVLTRLWMLELDLWLVIFSTSSAPTQIHSSYRNVLTDFDPNCAMIAGQEVNHVVGIALILASFLSALPLPRHSPPPN